MVYQVVRPEELEGLSDEEGGIGGESIADRLVDGDACCAEDEKLLPVGSMQTPADVTEACINGLASRQRYAMQVRIVR